MLFCRSSEVQEGECPHIQYETSWISANCLIEYWCLNRTCGIRQQNREISAVQQIFVMFNTGFLPHRPNFTTNLTRPSSSRLQLSSFARYTMGNAVHSAILVRLDTQLSNNRIFASYSFVTNLGENTNSPHISTLLRHIDSVDYCSVESWIRKFKCYLLKHCYFLLTWRGKLYR